MPSQPVTHQFWYNLTTNFGDAMSPFIVNNLLGRELPRAEPGFQGGVLIALGSILHVADVFENHLVWGTGYEPKYGRLKREKVNVAAVRGPVTAEKLGLKNPAMGDPALLLPKVHPLTPDASGGVVLVPHHTSLKWARYLPYRIVDPLAPWKDVVREIVSAKFVWCEAMHAAIVAAAYGVPWAWWKGRHGHRAVVKWSDWFGSIGLEPACFSLLRRKAAERWAANNPPRFPDRDRLLNALLEGVKLQGGEQSGR
ncbi:MAG: polysaccharide pyruvyl transferase family protein [Planctomycetota bacterium]|nr:polysaccharide pyruvyl transferase family protein [Planctomycetota bacterium]